MVLKKPLNSIFNPFSGEGDGHNRQRANGGAPRGGPGQYRRGAPQKQK